MYSLKQHILKTSLSEIQGLCELHVFIYWKTAVLSTSFTIQPLVLPYLIVQQASSSTLVSSRLRDEKKYVNEHCFLSFQFIPGSCCTDHRVVLLALKFLVSQMFWKMLPFTLWFNVKDKVLPSASFPAPIWMRRAEFGLKELRATVTLCPGTQCKVLKLLSPVCWHYVHVYNGPITNHPRWPSNAHLQ